LDQNYVWESQKLFAPGHSITITHILLSTYHVVNCKRQATCYPCSMLNAMIWYLYMFFHAGYTNQMNFSLSPCWLKWFAVYGQWNRSHNVYIRLKATLSVCSLSFSISSWTPPWIYRFPDEFRYESALHNAHSQHNGWPLWSLPLKVSEWPGKWFALRHCKFEILTFAKLNVYW
jgi:hypothetical protein